MKPQSLFRLMLAALATAALSAGPAEAHVIDSGGNFMSGLAHPFGGIDHVLAMIAVGLWAAHLGGRARWLVPASFVTMMALSGAAAMAGLAMPYIETGIALSVVALGALIFSRARLPVVVGMAVVGGFAVFHGLAHGLEVPTLAGLGYGLGFVLATAALHGLGLGAGLMMMRREGGLAIPLARIGGGATAAAGLVLMAL